MLSESLAQAIQMVNAIPGWKLPVLTFANHLVKLWTDRFAHVNGKQPLSTGALHLVRYFSSPV